MKIARPMFARACLGHISRCCHTVPIFLAYDAAVLCIVLSCNVMSIHLYNHYQCIYRRLRISVSQCFPEFLLSSPPGVIVCSHRLSVWSFAHLSDRLVTSFCWESQWTSVSPSGVDLVFAGPVWLFGHIAWSHVSEVGTYICAVVWTVFQKGTWALTV